jgi:regulatory protein
MSDAARTAYVDAIKMLAQRELSEAQIRQRLARHGHSADAVDAALDRLRETRAVDDTRVAEAIARTQLSTKRRGVRRAEQQIAQAGISRETARRAVQAVSQSFDLDAVLEGALAKRLRGHRQIKDDKDFRRLYRYLVGQGFEPDRVLAVLEKHKRATEKRDV